MFYLSFYLCTEQVSVLKGHTGLVKGVTWDPVGKYLASQSDDRSLRVWRTRDWQQEAIITEPFKEVSDVSYTCSTTVHSHHNYMKYILIIM